jgi:release factor glutamine methyltransferase
VKISDAIKLTADNFDRHDVPDARRDAELLVAFVTGKDKTFLITHPEGELSEIETAELIELEGRRASREPLQYILGRQEFYGLEFEVTPDVLIPRPETEILVERAIEFLKPLGGARFCEVGIGSGCISVSILDSLPNATAIAGDISDKALQVARRNAERNHVIPRLKLMRSDVFSNIPEMAFSAIVSNPPYVPDEDIDTLQAEVRDHEPRIALSGGTSGLSIIERVISGAIPRLESGGLLLLEIGFDQSEKVSALIDRDRWQHLEFLPDLQGIPRILFSLKR